MSDFLEVNLVQKISDKHLEEMLKILKPVAQNGTMPDGETKRMCLVKTKGVDRRETAYLWQPEFGREVHIAYGNGAVAMCPTFHFSSVFFKPSLAEVYASVRAFVPEWNKARFLWLDTNLTARGPMMWNNITTVFMARAHLFDTDFLRPDGSVVDDIADLDEEVRPGLAKDEGGGVAADKLIVDEIGNAWRVCWWLYEEGEQGAVLGEKLYTQAELDDTKEQADRDHLAASLAVQALKPERDSEWSSFYWESQAGAKKALAVANAAIKADRLRGKKEHRDWPEWALTALANKWRPPQNWKP